jgi:predicted RNA-binding protein with PUA-like domain
MKHWLMKSEPSTFSIDDLAKAPRKRTRWDGVRNFQVRNMLRDEMTAGDLALFWHSSCDVPGAYGIVKVVKGGYPDPSALDPKHRYYDPDSDPAAPRWVAVDVEFVRRFEKPITLDVLKANAGKLGEMLVLRRGNRLSITPVTAEQWKRVLALE